MLFWWDSMCKSITFFFFFWVSFNLWLSLLMIILFYKIETLIGFWYRRGLNPRSLIQPSETLPIELTGTHCMYIIYICGLSLYWVLWLMYQYHNSANLIYNTNSIMFLGMGMFVCPFYWTVLYYTFMYVL